MERINYCIGIAPNLADLDTTVLACRGSAVNRPISNLQAKLMGNFWRTPSLKPSFTQFTADYQDPDKRLARALVLGNMNLPERGSYLRVRKGASVDDEVIYPSAVAFLAASNATGVPSDLDDDPYAPDANYVTPTAIDVVMDVRLALAVGSLTSPLKAGPYLQAVQVAYGAVVQGVPGPTVEVRIYQAGVYQNLTHTEAAFPSGELENWVAEIKFDAADLDDPTGAGLQVRVIVTPAETDVDGVPWESAKLASVRLLATTTGTTYDLDTGWMEIFPAPLSTGWGTMFPADAGKLVMKTRPLFYIDGNGAPLRLTSRYTRVELMASPTGALSFTDPASGLPVTWMDIGRFAEGPTIEGMQMGAGPKIGAVDPSTRDISDGGVMWEDPEATYREIALRLNELDRTPVIEDFFNYIIRRFGTTEDLLVAILPEDPSWGCIAFTWGPLEKIGELEHDRGRVFRVSFQSRERL